MPKINMFINNKSVRMFHGFTLQQGFIFGFIDGTPFVSNGTIFSTHVNVYFGDILNNWQTRKIPNTDALYSKIKKVIEKNKTKTNPIIKNYANSAQLEQMRINQLKAEGKTPRLFTVNNVAYKKGGDSQRQIRNTTTEGIYMQIINGKQNYKAVTA